MLGGIADTVAQTLTAVRQRAVRKGDKDDFLAIEIHELDRRNPFSDRDLMMRYHWGLGVGHDHAHGLDDLKDFKQQESLLEQQRRQRQEEADGQESADPPSTSASQSCTGRPTWAETLSDSSMLT